MEMPAERAHYRIPAACNGRRMLCGSIHCQQCFLLSFAASPHSQLWDSEANGGLTPFHVRRKSPTSAVFRCQVCGHSFRKAIRDIEKKKVACSFCAGNKICGQPACSVCFRNSFASHPRSKQWSEKNTLQPVEVTLASNIPRLFECEVCSHTFESPPNFVTRTTVQASWCPYCAGKRLCEDAQCVFCFQRSFAAHPRSKFWFHDRNGDVKPRDKAMGTDQKFWFRCENNHEWKVCLSSVKAGKWCPGCRNKTERTVGEWLATKFLVEREKGFPWAVTEAGGRCRFDFHLPIEHILIELDGSQHYRPLGFGGDLAAQQQRDAFKAAGAWSNGYTLLRLLQEDVEYERGDWRGRLEKLIRDLPEATYCTVFCSSVTQFRRYSNNCFRTWIARQQQLNGSI